MTPLFRSASFIWDFVTSSCRDKNYIWTSYTWRSNSQGLVSLCVLKILPKATYILKIFTIQENWHARKALQYFLFYLGCFLKLHVQWRALYLPKRGLYRRLNCLIIIVIIPHCCFACLNPFSDKIRQDFLNANWFGIFWNIKILWSCLFGFFFILGCEKVGVGVKVPRINY